LSHDILKLDESFKYLYNVNDEKLWVRKTGATSLVFNENSNIQALVCHIPLNAIKHVDFKKNINLEKQRRMPPQPCPALLKQQYMGIVILITAS
jgi:hypothetical protein